MASRSESQSKRLLDTHVVMKSSTTSYEDINPHQVESPTYDPRRVDRLRRWCYSLHVLLCIIHLVLLAMSWPHPEHAITLPFDNSILTTGLSAFLQAFYSLYTIILVFMAENLALSTSLSRRQKLTTTHDISQAWGGLGAAILILWRQTKIAASPFAVVLVFLYLASISILHVASSSIMQFQPYNASVNMFVPSNSTWPDPSVNLSAIAWAEITPLAPLMPNFFFGPTAGIFSMSGLMGSTLYNTWTRNPIGNNGLMNASTISTNCGLLPISSSTSDTGNTNINAILSAVGNITTDFLYPWKDEIVFLKAAQEHCTTLMDCPLLFMVTTAMELDSSIQVPVSINTTWQYKNGGEVQASNTTAYLVACSLYTNQSTIDVHNNGEVIDFLSAPSFGFPQEWSLWSPIENGTDSKVLNSGISTAMIASYFPYELDQAAGFFCQQDNCSAISTTDIYLMSTIGINVTANNITSASESSAYPSVTLAQEQMEIMISQLAAQLIWLAGQVGENNGGFSLSSTTNYVTEEVPEWRLNINQVPVIFATSASLILLVVVYHIIGPWRLPRTQHAFIEGVSILEILWIGARVHNLRERFAMVEYPSLEILRSTGIFNICLANVTGSNKSESEFKEDKYIGGSSLQRLPSDLKSLWNGSTLTSLPTSEQACVTRARKAPSHTVTHRVGFLSSFLLALLAVPVFVSCYVLHGFLVLVHLVLMAVFAHHTEHRVVIPLDSTEITTVLSASLQLAYTLYTAVLVFAMQRLVSRRVMTSRQDLTSIHDISRASTGFGPAVACLWQQRKVSVSLPTTLCIVFQTFNSTIVSMVQSTSSWPNSSVNLQDFDWVDISPLVSFVNQFPALSTEGLLGSTVYDVPSVPPSSLNATVGTTTVHASCGLLSDLSWDPTTFSLNATILPLGSMVSMDVHTIWDNTVIFVNPVAYECSACDGYLLFLVTTAVDYDGDSLPSGTSVPMMQNYTQNGSSFELPIVTYLVGCSLNETTVLDTLDLQSNTTILSGLHSTQPNISAFSQPWTLWSPPSNLSGLDQAMSMMMASAPPIAGECTASSPTLCDPSSTLDAYIFESAWISVNGTTALDRYRFENAMSQIATQSIWLAGHLANGFQPANATSNVAHIIAQLRLNINILPLGFALGASVTIFLLAFYLIGVTPRRSLAFSSLGALEILWLESHSQRLHDHMLEIEDPSLDNLRSGSVIQVCIADELSMSVENWKDEQDDHEAMTLGDPDE